MGDDARAAAGMEALVISERMEVVGDIRLHDFFNVDVLGVDGHDILRLSGVWAGERENDLRVEADPGAIAQKVFPQ
jgi:hypothetical protein